MLTNTQLFLRACFANIVLIIGTILYSIAWNPKVITVKNFGSFAEGVREITPLWAMLFLLIIILITTVTMYRFALNELDYYKNQTGEPLSTSTTILDRVSPLNRFSAFLISYFSFIGIIFSGILSFGMLPISLHPAVLVIAVFVGLFINIGLFDNITNYRIISIPFSEFEIMGTGSKEFRFNVPVIIYGDDDSEENITIINKCIDCQIPKFREVLINEKKNLRRKPRNTCQISKKSSLRINGKVLRIN